VHPSDPFVFRHEWSITRNRLPLSSRVQLFHVLTLLDNKRDPAKRIGARMLNAPSTENGGSESETAERAQVGASDLQASPRSEGRCRLWVIYIRAHLEAQGAWMSVGRLFGLSNLGKREGAGNTQAHQAPKDPWLPSQSVFGMPSKWNPDRGTYPEYSQGDPTLLPE